jgi:chromosome segregation ATPase
MSSNLGAVEEDDGSALAEASSALEGIKSFNTEWRQEREMLLKKLEKEYGFALPEQVDCETGCEAIVEEGQDLADAEDEHDADCALENAQKELEDVRRRRHELEERASRPASRAGAQPSQCSSGGYAHLAESDSSHARLSSLRAEVERLKAADVVPAPVRSPLVLQPPEAPIAEERGAMADLNQWLNDVRALTDGASPKRIGQVASPTRVSPLRANQRAQSSMQELAAAMGTGSADDVSALASSKSELERQLDEILGEFDEFDRIASDLGTCLSPELVT